MKIEEMNSKEMAPARLNEKVTPKLPYIKQVITSDQIKAGSYQRKLNEKKIQMIVANFSENIANEPKLSYRDKTYYVFDGQHTICARKRMNGGNDLPIICKVFYGLSEEDEALLFAAQTGYSTKPTSGVTVAAKIKGRDPNVMAFKKATEDVGIHLSLESYRGPKKLRCINTAHNEYVKIGERLYKKAMRMIVHAWNASPKSLVADVVVPMCEFTHVYKDEFDADKLSEKLKGVNPAFIAAIARETGDQGGVKSAMRYILDLYNCKNYLDPLELKF